MDCTALYDNIDIIKNFTPNEFAKIFIDSIMKNPECSDIMSMISYLKVNNYEYYIQIMLNIGKGG
jgi:hypothetical protein